MTTNGDRFGRWAVVGRAPTKKTAGGYAKVYWHCVCDCGAEGDVQAQHLKSGRSKSCGCLKSELAAKQSYRHGGRDSRLYEAWTQMLQRCSNANHKSYKNYGGRGINVCDRWLDFALFRADVESSYSDGLLLDRVDNDGPYDPGNWKWSTPKESARNLRKTIYVEVGGKVVSLAEAAEASGLKYMTVYRRYRLAGESIELALRPVSS
jgi:hypothetical protein